MDPHCTGAFPGGAKAARYLRRVVGQTPVQRLAVAVGIGHAAHTQRLGGWGWEKRTVGAAGYAGVRSVQAGQHAPFERQHGEGLVCLDVRGPPHSRRISRRANGDAPGARPCEGRVGVPGSEGLWHARRTSRRGNRGAPGPRPCLLPSAPRRCRPRRSFLPRTPNGGTPGTRNGP